MLALAEAFPGAPIYTSTYVPEKMPRFAKLDVRTAYLQRPQDRSKSFTNSSQPCVFTPFESSIFRSTTSSSRAEAPTLNRSAKREMTKSTSAYLLELASKAKNIFERSQPEQKNKILRMLLANPTLKAKRLQLPLLKPFASVLDSSNSQN